MKTTFVKNRRTETERVLHACLQTSLGFYRDKKFVVLPSLIKGSPASVFLPPLAYQEYPHFWQEVRKIKLNFPIKAPPQLFNFIANQLEEEKINNHQPLRRFEKEWGKVEKKFWSAVKVLMPRLNQVITGLEVRVTGYGSISSYQFVDNWGKQPRIFYLRQDATIGHLAEAILTSLLYTLGNKYQMSWETQETMVDYFLTQTTLAKIFGNYRPTLSSLKKVAPKLKHQSDAYLASLGLEIGQSLRLKNKQIYLGEKNIDARFTKSEHRILSYFLTHQNRVIDRFSLSDILWQDDDKFSLWALHKQVQRLSYKLRRLNTKQILKPIRGRGYILE